MVEAVEAPVAEAKPNISAGMNLGGEEKDKALGLRLWRIEGARPGPLSGGASLGSAGGSALTRRVRAGSRARGALAPRGGPARTSRSNPPPRCAKTARATRRSRVAHRRGAARRKPAPRGGPSARLRDTAYHPFFALRGGTKVQLLEGDGALLLGDLHAAHDDHRLAGVALEAPLDVGLDLGDARLELASLEIDGLERAPAAEREHLGRDPRAAAVEVEPQLGLGVELVHVLPARSRRARELERHVAELDRPARRRVLERAVAARRRAAQQPRDAEWRPRARGAGAQHESRFVRLHAPNSGSGVTALRRRRSSAPWTSSSPRA